MMIRLLTAATLGALLSSSAFAQETSSPLVRQLYDGKWPGEQEAQELRDELYYQRAIFAYHMTLPALNVIGMRDGSEAVFGKGYHILPMWKQRMDAKVWVPTPNADIIYAMSYLDLKETGPLVVTAPAGEIAMLTDFFQRTITDIGKAGPDRGDGGLYLLLPPDYQGFVPDGYYTFRSSTYNVFLFFRTVLTQGDDGPDTAQGVAISERTRIYPLWAVEKDIPPMQFPDASGVRVDMMYPTGIAYFEKLAAFLDYEHANAFSAELRGVLASIGIIKGQPFEPTERQRNLLARAADMAPRMILASRMGSRPDGREYYYKDRRWKRAWSGATAEFMQDGYLDIDQRAAFFQYAYSSAPAMVRRAIRTGSKYPWAIRDADGDLLTGDRQYKLHLPAGIPSALYWAVTTYNVSDGTMQETSQPFPSRNSLDKLTYNGDGSVDLYFGSTKPDSAPGPNWIETSPDRNFWVIIRIYGSDIAFFDQTWVPDDLVKLN